jgi:hypothetical protein
MVLAIDYRHLPDARFGCGKQKYPSHRLWCEGRIFA